ncbi:MAG: phosphoribosyltransferase [Candidatus Korarchaeota archaeon]
MPQKIPCRFVKWEEIEKWTEDVAQKIRESGFKPDILIAIARSGFVPGRLLSDYLGHPNLVALKVEHWLDTTAQHKEDATIPYKIRFPIRGKNVLVIDDLVDTGKSILRTKEFLAQEEPQEIRSAVMIYLKNSAVAPDYYSFATSDWTWFIFPWNVHEDLRNLTMKLVDNNGIKVSELPKYMKEYYSIDVDRALISKIVNEISLLGKGRLVNDILYPP